MSIAFIPSDGNLDTVGNWFQEDGTTPLGRVSNALDAVVCSGEITAGTCVCLSFDGNGSDWTGGTITAPDNAVTAFGAIQGGTCTNRYDNSAGTTNILEGDFPGGITWPDSISYGEDDVAAAEAAAAVAQGYKRGLKFGPPMH